MILNEIFNDLFMFVSDVFILFLFRFFFIHHLYHLK